MSNSQSNWYFDENDLKSTPSICDGLDVKTERRYRKEAAVFIMECGLSMGIPAKTVATGAVFFHRFYMFQSFKSFPRYLTACTCLFLAGKVEETPRKCSDIISTARTILSDKKCMSFGRHPKEEVTTIEQYLLHTIKFDFKVEHPYSFIVKYAKCLEGDQLEVQKVVQMAWNFAKDSFSTIICLQWKPEIVAVGMIHLACKISKLSVSKWIGQLPEHLHWWDLFLTDVTIDIFDGIGHQILDLCQQGISSNGEISPSKSSSPPKLSEMSSTLKSSPVANVPMPTINFTDLKTPLPPPPLKRKMKSHSLHPKANTSSEESLLQHPLSKSNSPPLESSPVPPSMPTSDDQLGNFKKAPSPPPKQPKPPPIMEY